MHRRGLKTYTANERIDSLSSTAQEISNESDSVGPNEEPSTAEDVRQATIDGKSNPLSQCDGEDDPNEIFARPFCCMSLADMLGQSGEDTNLYRCR